MELTFTLSLPRDEASVPVVRHICRDALASLGVDDGSLSDIQVALSEACTNVLKHAAGTEADYEVTLQVSDHVCVIRVVDAGRGFDADSWPPDDTADGAEGGRGIQVMKALVDDLKFVSKPESGTVVHLEKSLALRETSVLQRLRTAAAKRGA